MKNKVILLLFVLFIYNSGLNAQNNAKVDSINRQLNLMAESKEKVNFLNTLSKKYQKKDADLAESYAMQALKIAEKIKFNKGVSKSYKAIGNVFKSNYKFKDAIEKYKISISVAKDIGYKVGVANSSYNLAETYVLIGEYKEAIIYAKESMEIDKELGNLKYVASTLYLIGNLYYRIGKYEEGLDTYSKAIEINLATKNGKATAVCYNGIGNILIKQGKLDEAIEYAKKSLKISRKNKTKISIRSSLNILGIIERRKGNYEESITYYKEVLKICTEIGDIRGTATSYSNIGTVYDNIGNYPKALEYYNKSVLMKEKINDKNGLAITFNNIGFTHSKQGNNTEALKYYKKSLELKKEMGTKKGVSNNLNNIGELYVKEEKLEIALDYFNNSLKASRETGNEGLIAWTGNLIGEVYLKQRRFVEAENNFMRSLALHKKLGEESEMVKSFNNLGKCYFEKGYFRIALGYYQKALIINLNGFIDTSIYSLPKELYAKSEPYLLETLMKKASILHLLYTKKQSIKGLNASIANYRLGFEVVNQMRNKFDHESAKLLLSENTKKYYSGAIQAAISYSLVEQGKVKGEEVLEFIEKAKSSTLSSHFNKLEASKEHRRDGQLFAQERGLIISRKYYETKIQKEKSKVISDSLLLQIFNDQLFQITKQYDSIVDLFKSKYPKYYQMRYESNVARISNIQNQLDASTAMINYFVGDTVLFIVVMTDDDVEFKALKKDSLFNQKIIDYHVDTKSASNWKEMKNSIYLYNKLIKPIEPKIKDKSRLVIIPDDNLYYLPFATLCKGERKKRDLSKYDYLIKRYSVSYNYSATLWLKSIERLNQEKANKNSFVGFAPVFGSGTGNSYIVSREWLQDSTESELEMRSVSSDMRSFNSLPYSENEINSIATLFAEKGVRAKEFLHSQANEANFKSNISNYKFIHIASHSFSNDEYPALSGIAFSQPDTTLSDSAQFEDGVLYSGETYALDLSDAELVVLSSCKSGLGKLIKGEGFLSLSRGFIYSGAPNIVFSLWSVKDEPTKDLMVYFYKNILKGKDYAEALRLAKLKLIKKSKTKLPKYWAGLVLVGE